MIKKISRNGYSIEKDSINNKELQKIKSELTVKPFVLKDYTTANKVSSFKITKRYFCSYKYIYKYTYIYTYSIPGMHSYYVFIYVHLYLSVQNSVGSLRAPVSR